MIYTSYEMIPDCQAGKPAGWSYFIANYVPVVRRILGHYHPENAQALLESTLAALREQKFAGLDPAPERQFVDWLRQQVLSSQLAPVLSELPLDLPALAEALQPLTVVEKESAWLETMRYPAADAGRMLRMDPATVEKIRERAAELIRGKVDRWRRTLLAENGLALGREAAALTTPDCVGAQALLEMIDGRSTWSDRQVMERHITGCWHCVDHFCRLHEVCDLLRVSQPLVEREAESFHRMFGIETRKSLWKKLRGTA